jgi:hypothetical protein
VSISNDALIGFIRIYGPRAKMAIKGTGLFFSLSLSFSKGKAAAIHI